MMAFMRKVIAFEMLRNPKDIEVGKQIIKLEQDLLML